jgi:hypothetical protein
MTHTFDFKLKEVLTSGSTVDCGTFNNYEFAMESAKKESEKMFVKRVILLDETTGEILFLSDKGN